MNSNGNTLYQEGIKLLCPDDLLVLKKLNAKYARNKHRAKQETNAGVTADESIYEVVPIEQLQQTAGESIDEVVPIEQIQQTTEGTIGEVVLI